MFSHRDMSNSLQSHELQYTRPPYSSSSPKVCPSSCPLHQWCHSAISSSDALFPSALNLFQHQDFSNELVLHIRWPKYWNFRFSISPSEYSGLISPKIAWFDILTVQGTLRSLFQHHISKALILWCSVFFTVQRSQLYITTGKTTALTIQSICYSKTQIYHKLNV